MSLNDGLIFAGVLLAAVVIWIAIVEIRDTQNAKRDAKKIRKTQLLDKHVIGSTTHISTSSAVGRGIVGAAVAGPVGAVAGAATAKQNTVTQEEYVFRVWWGDGKCTIEKCRYNDYWYNRYIVKIEP